MALWFRNLAALQLVIYYRTFFKFLSKATVHLKRKLQDRKPHLTLQRRRVGLGERQSLEQFVKLMDKAPERLVPKRRKQTMTRSLCLHQDLSPLFLSSFIISPLLHIFWQLALSKFHDFTPILLSFVFYDHLQTPCLPFWAWDGDHQRLKHVQAVWVTGLDRSTPSRQRQVIKEDYNCVRLKFPYLSTHKTLKQKSWRVEAGKIFQQTRYLFLIFEARCHSEQAEFRNDSREIWKFSLSLSFHI